MKNEFEKIEGNGILKNYYQEEDTLSDALRKRRQKLAETKIHLAPSFSDSDNADNLDRDPAT